MKKKYFIFGESIFLIKFNTQDLDTINYFHFMREMSTDKIDLQIEIYSDYGIPLKSYDVKISETNAQITYRRDDYLIEVDPQYKKAAIHVHDELALKHALMNLYSAFIVHNRWGLMIHSSCVVDRGVAHLFAGESGAGKSTAAQLSSPRDLLADEASILKITPNRVEVFNSPFNSEIMPTSSMNPVPLKSIQLLQQDLQNKKIKIDQSAAYMEMTNKIFYWSHSSLETKSVFQLLKNMIINVPVYKLHFQKNNSFWELIS